MCVMAVRFADRLARSTTDLLALVERLNAKGVAREFIDRGARVRAQVSAGDHLYDPTATLRQSRPEAELARGGGTGHRP